MPQLKDIEVKLKVNTTEFEAAIRRMKDRYSKWGWDRFQMVADRIKK